MPVQTAFTEMLTLIDCLLAIVFNLLLPSARRGYSHPQGNLTTSFGSFIISQSSEPWG